MGEISKICRDVRRVIILVLRIVIFVILLLILSSCSITMVEEEKLSDLQYEVVEYHFMSKELKDIYDKAMSQNERITYTFLDEEYLIVCYGYYFNRSTKRH